MSDIYTFGPTFSAENSNTSRHLAEFWMIEPEMAFADLEDNMDCAEAYLKFVVRYVLEHCAEDMAFFDQLIEKGLLERLTQVAEISLCKAHLYRSHRNPRKVRQSIYLSPSTGAPIFNRSTSGTSRKNIAKSLSSSPTTLRKSKPSTCVRTTTTRLLRPWMCLCQKSAK